MSCSKGKVRVMLRKHSGVFIILKKSLLLIGIVLVKESKNPSKAKPNENGYIQKQGTEVSVRFVETLTEQTRPPRNSSWTHVGC